ncbi:MAG: hypothetical protein EP335_11860 [Alphaproteobacteria bacterium]|nr:MAG: hypothetical protein EP335_11860 [Alphaproteobacteria bacterium]
MEITYHGNTRIIKTIECHIGDYENYLVDNYWGPARLVFDLPFYDGLPVTISNKLIDLQAELLDNMMRLQKCDLSKILALARTDEWQKSFPHLRSPNYTPTFKNILDFKFIEAHWCQGSRRQREGGPAVILFRFDGAIQKQEWMLESRLHRFSGPALIDYLPPKRRRKWYIYGQRITANEIRDVTGITGPIPDKFSEADTVTLKMHYG